MAGKRMIKMGLCVGRHNIPGIKNYIFPQEVDPLDLKGLREMAIKSLHGVKKLDLYVTGLTVALVEVINLCQLLNIDLTLYHYNKATNDYYPQEIWRI